ncbi:MAG: hypothetical protein V1653_03135, partial [bacterium]
MKRYRGIFWVWLAVTVFMVSFLGTVSYAARKRAEKVTGEPVKESGEKSVLQEKTAPEASPSGPTQEEV